MLRLLLVFGAMALVAACTLVYGPDSEYIVVATDPPQAECIVKNDDQEFGRVVPTPGGIEVQKSPLPLIISCSTQEIYLSTNPVPEPDAIDVGGVQFGGLVGTAVVPPTGPDHHYESPVLIRLHEPSPQ